MSGSPDRRSSANHGEDLSAPYGGSSFLLHQTGYDTSTPRVSPPFTPNRPQQPGSPSPDDLHPYHYPAQSAPGPIPAYQMYPYSGFYQPIPEPTSAGPSTDPHYYGAMPTNLLYQASSARERSSSHGSCDSSYQNIDNRHAAESYYYHDLQALQNLESRDTSKVELSPGSDYESSASEYDPKDRHSIGSLPDYTRTAHEQFNYISHTGVPVGSNDHTAPRSVPGYSGSQIKAHGLPRKERKGRRKLAPIERQQVHELRKMGACTRCWGLKMKCDDKSPCHRCQKLGGDALCVRVHFVDLEVFSKWLDESYSRTMMHHVLRWDGPPRSITISHERGLNLTLQLSVYPFIANSSDQINHWFKDRGGWRSTQTAAFGMKRAIPTDVLEKYIQDHTSHYVRTSFSQSPLLCEIFHSAYKYSLYPANFLLADTLQLWTAIQLLIRGASLHPASDALGIRPTPSGTIPLPKVLNDQLDHLLERRIWQLEKQILSELQKRIFARKRHEWLKIFFTLVVFMNALERDTWRLSYWTNHAADGYAWRHPNSPNQLIDNNKVLAESLSAHFSAISKGINPFALEWTRAQSSGLIGELDDQEEFLDSMEQIGCGLRSPEQQIRMRSVLAGYREDSLECLDFLYSGKVMTV